MKKFITKLYVVMVFTLFMMIAVSCDSKDSTKKIEDTKDNVDEKEDKEDSTDKQLLENGDTNELETIKETVLFEQDGVRVTAKELINDSVWGKGLKILIENDTDNDIGIQCNTIVVNNYMVTDLFSGNIAAGKKDNETITFSTESLESAGIDTISEINIRFHVFDNNSYDTLFDTEEITIQTSAYGTVEQPAVDEGKELLNQNGVRIVGKYVNEDSFWGAGVLLFIENSSGEDVLVQCDNMSINGFMVSPYFSSQVNKGRMAIDSISIMSSDLEENNITEVKDLEVIFLIINPESYDTIYESNPIPFSVE